MNLRKGLESLLEKINTNKIIIKPADKGSLTAVMAPKDYWNMRNMRYFLMLSLFITL